MAAVQIEYIWKIARPKAEGVAKTLMYAAYKTAMQTDPTTTQVLIRSYIHTSTRTRGRYTKDEPHLTISVKNAATAEQQKHQTSHGYTTGLQLFDVIRVSPTEFVAKDTESEAWPAEMATRPSDTHAGEPALLGPVSGFVTWPSEASGE